jgi:acetyl-CoA synthetase/medium-chain acyl-CoA synthetase
LRAVKAPEYFNFAADVFGHWARERPDTLALWCVDPRGGGEARLTFGELWERSRRAAHFFQQAGVGRGMPVVVVLPRWTAWWETLLGLIHLGALPIPCARQMTARDIAFRLQTAQVQAAITTPDDAGKFDGFNGVKILVGEPAPGWLDYASGVARASANHTAPPTRASDPGILFFTSATTGQPKMVLHSQASYGLAHRTTGQLWLNLAPGDVHWNLSDLGWAKAAWSSFFGPWHRGACVFSAEYSGRFQAPLALQILSEFPITHWCAPPTALRMVIREDLSRWRFPRLRHCVSAGEPLNPEVFSAWQDATGLSIHEGYGQTETVILVAHAPCHGKAIVPGSMGWAMPGFEIEVVDSEQRPVPAGVEGELALKVEPDRPLGLFAEYWRASDETAAHFRNGYYLTGDHVMRDDRGLFWFVGRKDDVIKSSGYRIGPGEVENALMEHPAVLEAAVIGKPDPIRGQIVKAYVILRRDWTPRDELKKELQDHCLALAAPYKHPREIEFVTELPKTISGKTRRVDLRQRD